MVLLHKVMDGLPDLILVCGHGLGQQIHQRGAGVLHEHVDLPIFQGIETDRGAGQSELLLHSIVCLSLNQLAVHLSQNNGFCKVGGANCNGFIRPAGLALPLVLTIVTATGTQCQNHRGSHTGCQTFLPEFHGIQYAPFCFENNIDCAGFPPMGDIRSAPHRTVRTRR